VLVPQFSTDDISPSPPLCIGCSEGRSTTQHALKRKPRSTAAPPAGAAAQQQQIRAFTADATATEAATATADVPPSHHLLGSFLRRRQGVNMVGDLAVLYCTVLYLHRSASPTLTHGRRTAAICMSSSAAQLLAPVLVPVSSSSPIAEPAKNSPAYQKLPLSAQHRTPNPRPHTVFKHQLCECAGQGREELDPNRSSHTPSPSSHY